MLYFIVLRLDTNLLLTLEPMTGVENFSIKQESQHGSGKVEIWVRIIDRDIMISRVENTNAKLEHPNHLATMDFFMVNPRNTIHSGSILVYIILI